MTKPRGIRAGVLLAGALAGVLVLLGNTPPPGPGPAKDVLYFFVTPEAEGAPEGARRAMDFVRRHQAEIGLRPVLLTKDFRALRTLTEASPLARTLRELEKGRTPGTLDLPLYDEEGVRLAEAWELRGVPSYVLVRRGRAHRTAGSSADLELLWECSP